MWDGLFAADILMLVFKTDISSVTGDHNNYLPVISE